MHSYVVLISVNLRLSTVKIANSASPFKFPLNSQIPTKTFKKLVLRMIIMCLSHTRRNWIQLILLMKYILSFSRVVYHGILTWWNLKRPAELANLIGIDSILSPLHKSLTRWCHPIKRKLKKIQDKRTITFKTKTKAKQK